MTSNRFQENFPVNSGEIQTSVFGSCLSIGLANITAQNISDNTIYALAPAHHTGRQPEPGRPLTLTNSTGTLRKAVER